jgi:hypothetical protein
VPVRVPPLCEMHTEFSIPGEPVMDGPPGCPHGSPRTPAGDYVSTAFIGNHSLLPYTFTLPDGWQVQPRGDGFVVHLSTRSTPGHPTGITVVSDPRVVGSGAPVSPQALFRSLSESPELRVRRVPTLRDGPPWWESVDISVRPGARIQATCRTGLIGETCVPVLASGYGRWDETTVGVLPGATARLLLNGWVGANIAVWIWDVTDDAAAQTLAVARSIQLWPPRPGEPS